MPVLVMFVISPPNNYFISSRTAISPLVSVIMTSAAKICVTELKLMRREVVIEEDIFMAKSVWVYAVFFNILGDINGTEKEAKYLMIKKTKRKKTVKESREAGRCYQSVSERIEVNQHLLST
jgi:hypothetical protein